MEDSYEKKFWEECEKYHELVKHFERNIVTQHPDSVSSRDKCVCLSKGLSNFCTYAKTSVEYYDYNGTSIKNL